MNKKMEKIVGINLLILLGYTVFMHGVHIMDHSNKMLEIAFSLMFLISLHTLIIFGISIGHFANKKKDSGKAFLLSTALVLVIGFSSCYGSLVMS